MSQNIPSDLLAEQGIDYTTETIDLDKIDRASLTRQIRMTEADTGDYHPQLVEDYARAMLDGDHFPPIVVRRTKSGGFLVLDGVHRWLAATEIGAATIVALVAEVTLKQARQVAILANVTHGERLPQDRRIKLAAVLVEEEGMTQKRAARLMRVSAKTLSTHITRRRTISRAVELGIRGFDRLSAARQEALGRIGLDGPFVTASRVAISRKLSAEDVGALAREVKSAQSEADATKAAQSFKSEVETDGQHENAKHPTGGPVWRLGMACRNIDGLTEDDFRRDMAGRSTDEMKDIAEMCSRTATRLRLFAGA